jgi:hypothetical protein
VIPARLSANTDRNAPLKDPFPRLTADETNDAWLQRVLAGPLKDRRGPFVLLVGGAALSHFRVRVAQSHARVDLLPSYWSHCALVQRDAGPGQRHVVRHVPFDLRGDIDDMPARNGVERADITAFADPTRYPNLALLAFGVVEPEVEETAVKSLRGGRLTEDLVSPLVPWLAYIWGAGPNPLLAGTPAARGALRQRPLRQRPRRPHPRAVRARRLPRGDLAGRPVVARVLSAQRGRCGRRRSAERRAHRRICHRPARGRRRRVPARRYIATLRWRASARDRPSRSRSRSRSARRCRPESDRLTAGRPVTPTWLRGRRPREGGDVARTRATAGRAARDKVAVR